MFIFMALFFFGAVVSLVCVYHVFVSFRRRAFKRAALAIALPVALWVGILALLAADNRFVTEEIRKNGGEPPDWVW